MIRQVVIDKTSKLVKRHGYVDFTSRPDFDPETEQVIEKEFEFIPDISDPFFPTAWVYNAADDTFEKVE
jgi:hypothetical protein